MLDVLIIGSGGAGLTAALSAKEKGASVLVVGKAYPTNSQTSMAQGGMNAALGNVGEDSIESHIADTIKSARGLCNEGMVRQMCEDAPKAIAWLESIGVPFSRLDVSIDVKGLHPKGISKGISNDLLQGNESFAGLTPSKLFDSLDKDFYLYFVHSYHAVCEDKYAIGKTHYGYEFVSAVQNGNIYGIQPHPEKSHENGLKIIENFAKL